jgi:NDP-sugar pyrophosphorylase family protein
MDVRAIVLVGPSDNGPSEQIAGVPIALLDVLGKPVAQRVAERLRQQGVDEVAIIAEPDSSGILDYARTAAAPGIKWTVTGAGEVWRAAEQSFSEFAQNGADVVLAVRLGPYAEIDFDHLVQSHIDTGARVTAAVRDGVEFGAFAISSSRRNDAAFLFRHHFTQCRVPCTPYSFTGYFNRMETAQDLRALSRDGLLQKNAVRPAGREVKPGVWAGDGARIDRGARVLAPAYIGARARVRAAAVLTRGTTVEHHGEVDCGSVIEDANVLPFCYVGAGLDVSHAVVGFRQLVHLKRNAVVEFSDPKLVGMLSVHAPVRALATAAGLAAFLPKQIFLGFFGKSRREKPADLPVAVHTPAAALHPPDLQKTADENPAEFPSNLAVARRYGNE